MSSMGVRRREVKAPEAAPQATRAVIGRVGVVDSGSMVLRKIDCAIRY
jgi:hypothetical protein